MNGLSPVKAEVVKIIQDHDDEFWPMLDQVLRITKPFVDAIALCEGRSVTLADSMLYFLGAARSLSLLTNEPSDDAEFLTHARAVVDKRFKQIATPLHRLALFLHPLCRKLAVLDVDGHTLREHKLVALEIAKKKWGWGLPECKLLVDDMDAYFQCRDVFAGGQKDCLAWWTALPAKHAKHPLKQFAMAILSIVPHAAEIEHLFSSLAGIQSPKRNNLSVATFEKLARVRAGYVEEARQRGAETEDRRRRTRMHAQNSPPLEKSPELEHHWEPPMAGMEGKGSEDSPISGVDVLET